MFKKNHKPRPLAATEEDTSSSDLVSRRAKLEDERMSRRQALRKMGITTGMALVALPSIDELARLAAKGLASSNSNSEIANSVAQSLRHAGVAFANPNNPIDREGYSETDCEERCLLHAAEFEVKDGILRGILTPTQSNSLINFCKSQIVGENWSPYLNCMIDGLNRATGGKYQDGVNHYITCCRDNCGGGVDNPNSSLCQNKLDDAYNLRGTYTSKVLISDNDTSLEYIS